MLERCREEAEKLDKVQGRQRHWCIVTDKKGRILSQAPNSYVKTHPYQASMAEAVGLPDRVFLHAEIAALVRCRKKPYAIYIARAGGGYSKPCPVCMAAIKEAGIAMSEVYYE